MQVIKRDGRIANFNVERIVDAITLAMAETQEGVDIELAKEIGKDIEKELGTKNQTTVYEIQDLVEKKLMASPRKEVAQRYITYRYNRDIARKAKSKDVFLEIIERKSDKDTDETTGDFNTPEGIMMRFASETTKPFVDDFLLSEGAKEAVDKGYIFIHNKDYYPTKSLTCVQIPLDKILKEGFKSENGEVRPAKRIETAEMLGFLSLELVENEMHGTQGIPAIDYYLAPYVKKAFEEEISKIEQITEEDLSMIKIYQPEEYETKEIEGLKGGDRYIQIAINRTVNRVHQAMEALVHDINVIGRGKGESSIDYGTDTSPEGRCIIRELLNTTREGIGKGATSKLLIQIWKKKIGVNFNPEDRNYDLYKLALEVAKERQSPNFVNLDTKFNSTKKWKEDDEERFVNECAMMGDGIRVFKDRFGDNTSIARGNLSTTSINLPRIAIESTKKAQEELELHFEIGRGSEDNIVPAYSKLVKKIFLEKLESYADIVARQLYDRYTFQATAKPEQFPLLMSKMWINTNEKFETNLKHGTLSIGYIGLAEALVALTGKHHGESEQAQKLGLEIAKKLHDLCGDYSERYDMNYGVYAICNKYSSTRLARKDRRQFGTIMGVNDKDEYTFANHLPKDFEISEEKRAEIEAEYHEYALNGHAFIARDLDNVEDMINYMDKYGLGYVIF